MIKFRHNGVTIALAEHPVWVKLLDNGAYGLCSYEDAQGVAINGTVYNMPGQSISENGEVTYEISEMSAYIFETGLATGQALTQLELNNVAAQQEITELELTIMEG